MPRASALLSIVLVVMVVLPATGYAAIPKLIALQGKLMSTAGIAQSGSFNMAFKIYNVYSSGSALWTELYESENNITVDTTGIFTVMLGSRTALDLPFNESYFLEVNVSSTAAGSTYEKLSPRFNMTAVGYTFTSNTTMDIADNVVTAGKIASGAVTTSKIATGAITNDTMANDTINVYKIMTGSITTSKIATGAITNDTMANGTINAYKLMPGAVTNASIANDTISTSNIMDTAISSDKLAIRAVTSAKLDDLSIDATKIAAGAITTAKIADGAVTTASIGDYAINVSKHLNTNTTTLIKGYNFTTDSVSIGTQPVNILTHIAYGPPTGLYKVTGGASFKWTGGPAGPYNLTYSLNSDDTMISGSARVVQIYDNGSTQWVIPGSTFALVNITTMGIHNFTLVANGMTGANWATVGGSTLIVEKWTDGRWQWC